MVDLVRMIAQEVEDFDLSIIMSCYQRYESLKRVLPHNARFLERNGIEVIIVLDDLEEELQIRSLLEDYPFISWVLIVNDEPHPPRNHAPVLNVGLRYATRRYIMQIDPEIEYWTDAIGLMRLNLANYPKHYAIGYMAYCDTNTELTEESICNLDFIPYGNIMVERDAIYQIGGYDELFTSWGGEDDNLRARLDMIGYSPLYLPEAQTIHREDNYSPEVRAERIASHSNEDWIRMRYPNEAVANGEGWGYSFGRLGYSWEMQEPRFRQLTKYLLSFPKYWIRDELITREKYQRLLLCQAHDEEELICEFLEHMSNYFDGVILLDDGSTDRTWELAMHPKLMLKVYKNRICFDDLSNRNILLDLASFFSTEWLCFMDIDERFAPGLDDIESITLSTEYSVLAFKAVYLWDSEEYYKCEIPQTNGGVLDVPRMFRPNLRREQIYSHQKLHFFASPRVRQRLSVPILVLDKGCLSATSRQMKYERYTKEDTQGILSSGYVYMLSSEHTAPVIELCEKIKHECFTLNSIE